MMAVNTAGMITKVTTVTVLVQSFIAVDMADMLSRFPADTVVMGNIDPAAQFRNGTPDSIRQAVKETMEACRAHPNVVISPGCDIPPLTPWENIDAFFAAVHDFYNP